MHPLDAVVLLLYFVAVFALAWRLRRRAVRGVESYFLGDRGMRWWLLGASGMASNVDMTGTMVIAAMLMVFGFGGFWIELRGGVVLIMAFYLAFMGKWTRRSGRMTVAEWMEFRFGPGWAGRAPRLILALFNVAFTTWAISYFAVGTNKFVLAFMPPEALAGVNLAGMQIPGEYLPSLISAGLIILTMIYTSFGGLYGVVWTDVFQGGLILFMSLYFSVRAFLVFDPAMIAGWSAVGGLELLPPWKITPPPGYAEFEMLGMLVLFYLLKTTIDGLSGAGGYVAQRYFAAASERECGYVSLLWIFLMAFRWPLMMSIAILALSLNRPLDDPELALPVVLEVLTGPGLRGVMLAALLAAAMSTYSSMLNAGASYVVQDIYRPFVRPRAGQRELVAVGAASGALFVIAGLLLAYRMESINRVWDWLCMGLGAGVLLPNLLRWYWWRLNGWGYTAGAAGGMAGAFALRGFAPEAGAALTFACICACGMAALLLGTYLTRPTPLVVLQAFYRQTRPWGAWGPATVVLSAGERAATRAEHRADFLALLFAVPWQCALFMLPMAVIVHQWSMVGVLAIALGLLSVGLYRVWFRRLGASASTAESRTDR